MRRNIRSLMIVLATVVVVATACGDSSTDDSIVESTQVSVTEPDAPQASGDVGSEPSTTVTSTVPSPAPSTTVSKPDGEPDPPVPDTTGDEPEPATSTTSPDEEVDRPDPIPADLDASAILSAAGEASVGQPVRGEFSVAMSPGTDAVLASGTFETGADGNTAMTFSFFGFSIDFRFVDGSAYVQLPPELLSSLGLQTTVRDAWLTVDEASAVELGVGCPSPLSFLDPGGSMSACDPLSDTAMLLPEFVDDATIVGRETLRGFEATVIRLTLSGQDLIGVGLESMPDSETGGDDLEAVEEMFPSDAEIQADVWIDDDLRILRTVIDLGSLMPGLAGSDGEGFEDMPQLVATTDYYDHGATIEVEAPLPEQVIGDLADLQASAPSSY